MPQTTKKEIPSTLIDCVAAYAQAGYATFGTYGDKEPASKWKASQVDTLPNMLKYPEGQFGVRLKADDLVIDLDPRNMKGRKVWSEIKTLVSTAQDAQDRATIVQTGNKGLHIYLRKPKTFNVRKHLKEYPGVDFLTKGTYVIGAGSNVDNKPYVFLRAPFAEVQTPGGLLNIIKRTVIDLGEARHKGFSDTQDNIERYVEYLNKQAQVAIQGEQGDVTTFKVACRGREFNLSQQTTFNLMAKHYNPKCVPMWSLGDLQQKVSNAYSYNEAPAGTRDPAVVLPDMEVKEDPKKWILKLEKTAKDVIRATLKNAVLLLKHEIGVKGAFIYNEFNERMEVKGVVPWADWRINRYNAVDDREIECIRLHLAQTHFVEFSSQTMWKAVDLVAAGNTYHPIKDVLATYKWDGRERLNTWLPKYCGAADTPLNRQMGRKVLCAMVGRVFNPGCKYDYVLVMEGVQGIGKSTTCEILGGDWYGDAPIDPKDKDIIPYIHSKWLIELSEMVTTRKTESDRLKNFLSRREDDVRLPYARTRQRFPRQCIFIGTINPDDVGYLTDSTGNRRFWPVHCESFDMEALKRDREQLLAEAVIEYKKGESLTLSYDLMKTSEDEAMKRLADDPWRWVIAEWAATNPDQSDVTTQHIYRNVIGGNIQGMHTGHQRRIATALKLLGWRKMQTLNGMTYVKPVRVEATG